MLGREAGAGLDAALDALHRLLLVDQTPNAVLGQVATLAMTAVPGCDLSTVSTVDGSKIVRTAGTAELADRFDSYQYERREGPCLHAAETRVLCRSDLTTESRWPYFVERSTADGLRGVCSVPLLVGDKPTGVMNLYALQRAFDDEDERVATTFGESAAVTLANASAYEQLLDLVDNLRVALESRDVIGQAKGIVMAHEKCTSEQAFAILRRVSQESHVKLRDVARQVVDTGTWT
jgi:GAF domain-containing protein